MKRRGVKIVEGYPVTHTKDGRRIASKMAWTGPEKVFEEFGFKTVQSEVLLRPLVRLDLR
ncbi:hypothetical protein FJY84_09285 [Candidatus Bathyarchaeota archaeon]|nr:hypothetical protein [Candidatus Bathyarchaeota archaeon]